MTRHICPRCYLPAIPVMYGYPGEHAAELIYLGRAAGGGCMVTPKQPSMASPRGHLWRDGKRVVPAGDDPVSAAARLYLDGDLAGAEETYRSIIADRHPDAFALRHALALVLYEAGRMAEGEAEYRAMRAAAGRPMTAGVTPTYAEITAIIERRYRDHLDPAD